MMNFQLKTHKKSAISRIILILLYLFDTTQIFSSPNKLLNSDSQVEDLIKLKGLDSFIKNKFFSSPDEVVTLPQTVQWYDEKAFEGWGDNADSIKRDLSERLDEIENYQPKESDDSCPLGTYIKSAKITGVNAELGGGGYDTFLVHEISGKCWDPKKQSYTLNTTPIKYENRFFYRGTHLYKTREINCPVGYQVGVFPDGDIVRNFSEISSAVNDTLTGRTGVGCLPLNPIYPHQRFSLIKKEYKSVLLITGYDQPTQQGMPGRSYGERKSNYNAMILSNYSMTKKGELKSVAAYAEAFRVYSLIKLHPQLEDFLILFTEACRLNYQFFDIDNKRGKYEQTFRTCSSDLKYTRSIPPVTNTVASILEAGIRSLNFNFYFEKLMMRQKVLFIAAQLQMNSISTNIFQLLKKKDFGDKINTDTLEIIFKTLAKKASHDINQGHTIIDAKMSWGEISRVELQGVKSELYNDYSFSDEFDFYLRKWKEKSPIEFYKTAILAGLSEDSFFSVLSELAKMPFWDIVLKRGLTSEDQDMIAYMQLFQAHNVEDSLASLFFVLNRFFKMNLKNQLQIKRYFYELNQGFTISQSDDFYLRNRSRENFRVAWERLTNFYKID